MPNTPKRSDARDVIILCAFFLFAVFYLTVLILLMTAVRGSAENVKLPPRQEERRYGW